MWEVSGPDRFARALAGSHKVSCRVELWSEGVLVTDHAPFEDGTVTDTWVTAGVRRSLDLSVEPTAEWMKWLRLPRLELRPYRGIQHSSTETQECPLGRYPFLPPSQSLPASAIKISADDYYQRVTEGELSFPVSTPEGRAVDMAAWVFYGFPWIGSGAYHAVITSTNSSWAPARLWDKTRHEALTDFATTYGLEFFCDRMGSPTIGDMQVIGDPTTEALIGAGGGVEVVVLNPNWDQVFNMVSVTSSAQNVNFPAQTAWLPEAGGDETSPWRIGFRVKKFASPLILTAEDAARTASTLLVKVSATAQSYEYTCVPDPRRDAGDTILGSTTDGKTVVGQIATVTHPLTAAGRQKITTRSTQLPVYNPPVVFNSPNWTVTAVHASTTSAVRVPSVSGGAVAAAVIAVRATTLSDANKPVMSGGAVSGAVTAVKATAASTAGVPFVSGASVGSVAPSRALTTTAAVVPVVAGTFGGAVTAVHADATTAAGVPAVAGTATAVHAAATTAAGTPAVSGTVTVAVIAVHANATTTAGTPFVSGASVGTVSPPRAAAATTTGVPTVTGIRNASTAAVRATTLSDTNKPVVTGTVASGATVTAVHADATTAVASGDTFVDIYADTYTQTASSMTATGGAIVTGSRATTTATAGVPGVAGTGGVAPEISTRLNAENGTDNATLTAGNVPATQVQIGGTSTATFSDTHAHTGTLSYKFTASATTDVSNMRVPLAAASKTGFTAGYVWLDAAPSVDVRFASLRSSLGPAASLVITSGGLLRVTDTLNATVATSTAAFPLSQWVRVTLAVTVATATTGTGTAAFYLDGVATPVETLTIAAANLGTSNMNAVDVGKNYATATAAPFTLYTDDWEVGTGLSLPPLAAPIGTLLTAENGTNGTTLTTGNVPSPQVQIGTTSTATFSNTHAHTGGLSYKFTASATTDICNMRVPLDDVTTKQGFVDGYIWIDAYPSADLRVFNVRSSLGSACTMVITSTGKYRLTDGLNATVATSTASFPLSQWVRVTLEVTVGPTTSTGAAAATFRPAGVDAPTETLTTTTANLGTSLLVTGDVGKINGAATASAFTMYVDDWKVGAGPLPAIGAAATALFPPTGIHADGVTDDYAAINNAINAALAGGGGIVQLGAGVHLISRWLQMKAGVTLAGAGKGITTIKAGPTFLSTAGNHGGHPGISTDNADNVTIRNLTLDMSGDTNDGNLTGRTSEYCVDIRTSTNVLVSNVAVRNPYTYSIAAAGADHFRITGCDVTITSNGRYDQLDQIHVLNSNTGIIDNNLVDAGTSPDADDGLVAHTLGAGGTVHHIRYLNNKVRCGQGGHLLQAALGADGNTIHDILIADNELWGSTRGVMVGWYSTTTATVDKVSIDGNDFHDNGYAVDIATVGANLTNTTATNNRTHATGVLQIAAGTGNSVSGTTPY